MRNQFQKLVSQGEDARDKLREAINNLPETSGVTKLGNNCVTVPLSLLSGHNNWSPSYWISKETKQLLLNVVDSKRPVDGFIKAMDEIIKTGCVIEPKASCYTSAGPKIRIAPNVLEELKKVWNCLGCTDYGKEKLPANESQCLICNRFYGDRYRQ
jgi:hypothetical protein